MLNHRSIALAMLAVLLVTLPADAALTRADDAQRDAFRRALDRAEAGERAAGADEAQVRDYLLYPYLLAARIRAQLGDKPDEDDDAAAQAFLQQYPDVAIARELRRSWLLSLADRGQWGAYLANYADLGDPALRCHQLQAWIESGAYPELRDEILQVWLTGTQMPQSCVAPFAWLKDQGALTPERNEQRARLALEAGSADLADWLLRQVPAERQAPLRRWLNLLRSPRTELAAIAKDPAATFHWPALLAGFQKLARADSEAGRAAWRAFGCTGEQSRGCARLGADNAALLERELALAYAWERRAEAVEHFRHVPDRVLDERSHEWRLRAALWHGDYEQAAAWVHQLPPAMAQEDRWIYWRARAQELSGRGRQAIPIYQALTATNGYAGVFAAWRLQQRYRARSEPAPLDVQLQQRLLRQAATLRARELFLLGRPDWANAEWRLVLQDLDPAARLQAARLASAWGWHVQAVQTFNAVAEAADLELTHPDAYRAEIVEASRLTRVPPEWIYGVMRQESLFMPRAVSKSQALGLLQLLMPTAQDTARRWKRPSPSREDLFRPEVNVPLGAAYLRDMTDRFGGQFALTLAAYNAGPNAVARWLPASPMEPDIWIENIPFNETRGYVQKILWHMAAYATRTREDGFDPAPLLQPIRRPPAP